MQRLIFKKDQLIFAEMRLDLLAFYLYLPLHPKPCLNSVKTECINIGLLNTNVLCPFSQYLSKARKCGDVDTFSD